MTEKVRAVRILFLTFSSKIFSTLDDALKNSRYSAITASTTDQAVAICVSQFVAAAFVDAKFIQDQE